MDATRVLALILLASLALAQTAPQIQPFVAGSKLFAIYKPAGWQVKEEPRPDSFRITVNSPDGASSVDFFWARNGQRKPGALESLRAFRELLAMTHTDAQFSGVFVSNDSTRAIANLQFTAGSTRVRGRYYFESQPGGLSAQGYSAPESRLASERPVLLNVMASLAFTKAPPPTSLEPRFVELPLQPRQAQDRSLSLKVPADWGFLAAGGRVVTAAPDGSMGFIFTTFEGNPMLRGASVAQGVLAYRYLPPAQALGAILQGFGHRDYRVQSAQPDAAANQEFMATVRRRCDAADILASWTSARGARCVGSFKMVNALPSATGLWFCIIAGIWGPETEFYRYYPALEQIGSSFSINDQFARRYIRAGLENLRRLQQQTMAAMQDLNRSREQNQRDWEARQARKDYMESKWDDYRRGNSYWISDLEGGKVYHTDTWGTRDTVTGDYYEGRGYNWVNFDGENPRYREGMREVSSYELQQMQR
ncbi:MAG: hypothetical protein NTY38_03455 [Acidobacteria bacterium]|nr:hypothetical protein [Acidobacteriota bacterium]